MTSDAVKATKMAIVCAFATGLSGCATPDYEVPDNSGLIIEPRRVETLGETIARERQGEDGCLVAGNLNNGGECKKLRETISPPPPLFDPEP